MMKKDQITMTSNQGIFRKGNKLYKAHHYIGNVRIVYEEIDLQEYDKRIHLLAEKIASQPDVDLLDVLKDALYDVSLKRLEMVEQAFIKELAKEKPQIRTTKRDRGTCINIAIGKRFALEVRQ